MAQTCVKLDPHVIITDRLFLRPVELGDAAETAALMSPKISANLTSWPTHMTVTDACDRISDSRREAVHGRWIDWGIFLKEDLHLIGWVGVGKGSNPLSPLNIGYWVGDIFQRQRYGTEAVTAIVKQVRTLFDETTIDAAALPSNIASIRILKRLGFNEHGRRLEHSSVRGRQEEFVQFRLELAPAKQPSFVYPSAIFESRRRYL
jgi:ribosomal-protein-alanine N-acetyltransferase